MKYDTQTRVKYLLPFRWRWKDLMRYRDSDISDKAVMRLKWIDYIVAGHNILQTSRHFDHPEATIRYWYNRFNPDDLSSLEDKSKSPHECRRSPVSLEEAQRVIELRTDRRYQG